MTGVEGAGEVYVGRVAPVAAGGMPPSREAVTVREVRPEGGSAVVYEQGMKMADVERAAIAAALKATRGNRRKAAETLGIGERTLYRKLKEYELESEP